VSPLSSARLANSLFRSSFSSRPAVVVTAPGRVNLIGEHTDYNGGPVLPLAVERRTAVAAAPADEWSVVSALDGVVRRLDLAAPMSGDWTGYLVGVIQELAAVGAAPRGARVAVATTLPIGAGLSSSAALTVAAARALALAAGRRMEPDRLVDVAYRAEHDRVGVRCGRMDQTVAVHAERGSALRLETATGALTRIPFPGRLWVMETGVARRLAEGGLNRRRLECEEALAYCREWRRGLTWLAQLGPADLPELERRLPPPLVPRVRHVVTETARTRAAAAALVAGDLVRLGRLLVEGHESLRTDFQSTIAEADHLVASAVQRGAYGARLTGAGWGGAVAVLLPEQGEARIAAQIGEDFRERFGRVPVAWSTRGAAGVRREAVPV
jgi:galactokinase